MWNARSARWPLGLRWAGRSAFPLGFLIPVFVRRTFDQCRRFESAFSSENAAGKWRRQWHPPGPAQLIALDFFFSPCVHFCECRVGGISYFRVRARMDRRSSQTLPWLTARAGGSERSVERGLALAADASVCDSRVPGTGAIGGGRDGDKRVRRCDVGRAANRTQDRRYPSPLGGAVLFFLVIWGSAG